MLGIRQLGVIALVSLGLCVVPMLIYVGAEGLVQLCFDGFTHRGPPQHARIGRNRGRECAILMLGVLQLLDEISDFYAIVFYAHLGHTGFVVVASLLLVVAILFQAAAAATSAEVIGMAGNMRCASIFGLFGLAPFVAAVIAAQQNNQEMALVHGRLMIVQVAVEAGGRYLMCGSAWGARPI